MTRRSAGVLVGSLVLWAIAPAWAQKNIAASEAKSHIGEQATVCGKVVSTRYAESSRGRPTFLNFDQPYPNQIFTVVIWGNDRSKFGNPEIAYRGKGVCVSGLVNDYRNVPEIVVTDPSQLKLGHAD